DVDMKQSFKISIPNGDVGNEYIVIIKRHECHREALFAEMTLGIPHAFGAIPFRNHSHKPQQRQEIAASLTSGRNDANGRR
ncbi:MAG TPA: hypothetical protein VKA34_18060, partial [Balneolales bacterium]|nr:hypothetical protein [Balneolales bacterium]